MRNSESPLKICYFAAETEDYANSYLCENLHRKTPNKAPPCVWPCLSSSPQKISPSLCKYF